MSGNPGVYGLKKFYKISGAGPTGATMAQIGNDTSDTCKVYAALTVYSDQKLYFRDSGIYLQSGADGKLTIAADGTGADDITLNGTVTAEDNLTLAAGKSIIPDNGTTTASSGAATLNKLAGVITSEALTTAAGGTYTLTITNSTIAATDIVLASVYFGTASAGTPAITKVTPSSGSLEIVVQNIHASAAFDGTIKIAFYAMKAS